MKRSMVTAFAAGLACLLAGAWPARAQVGHDPEHSPYRDLEEHQTLSAYVGSFAPALDPAKVAPRGGTEIGAHYAWNAGGPAWLTAQLGRISSQRLVRDPVHPARDVGLRGWPLYAASGGLELSLPGRKSWHRLVPVVRSGVGFVSDLKTKADTGGYRFGTRFAFDWGAGVRWVPGGSWGLRADWINRLYTVAYPNVYYNTTIGGGSAILSPRQSKSVWTNNPSLTLGISYLYSR